MTDQRSHMGLSTWLLQVFGPLWLLTCLILFVDLLSMTEGLSDSIGSTVLFIGFYGVLQLGAAAMALDDASTNTSLSAGQRMLGLFLGLGVPAFFGIVQHPHTSEAGLWHELVVPMLVMAWIGISAFHLHVSTATLECRVHPLLAIIVSSAVILLALVACLRHTNLAFNGAVFTYSLTIFVVAALDRAKTNPDSAPS